MANEIWRLPYSAAQLENAVTNQVPRINSTTKHWERWDIATGAWVDTGVSAAVDASTHILLELTLAASGWTERSGYWTCVPTFSDDQYTPVEGEADIDLMPTGAQLAQLSTDGVVSLSTGFYNGAFVAVAVGAAPTTSMTVQGKYYLLNDQR